MIIKYAYAYANPTGTFFVGYRTGVVQHKLSAQAMSALASNEGGILSWLRRTITSDIGGDELFEMLDVTPKQIKERGLYTGEEIKELYKLVEFDHTVDGVMKSYAKQVHEALEDARNPIDEIKVWIRSLVKQDVIVDASVDEKDPQVVNVQLRIPLPYIQVTIKGVQDGSQNRT